MWTYVQATKHQPVSFIRSALLITYKIESLFSTFFFLIDLWSWLCFVCCQQSNGNNYMPSEPRRKRELPARPNHILLYTIINPAYPITVVSVVCIICIYFLVQNKVCHSESGTNSTL